MKFSDLEQGTLARTRARMRVGAKVVEFDVRIINPQEEAGLLQAAKAFAAARGDEKATDGEALFDYGRQVHLAALACVDPSSPADAPAPFFDGGAEQILGSKLLTREHVAYICERQEMWQQQNSPYMEQPTPPEFLARVAAMAKGEIDPFVELPPFMRWRCMHTLASLLSELLWGKDSPGSSPPETGSVSSAQKQEGTAVVDEPLEATDVEPAPAEEPG